MHLFSILKTLSQFVVIAVWMYACQNGWKNDSSDLQQRNEEAREDSVELANAYARQALIEKTVVPIIETDPVGADPEEDAADDPAIWYNTANPSSSLIFGTNKKSGVYSYDLQGAEQKFYELGMVNNIDIRKDVKIGAKSYDILGGSNRTDNSVIIYQINSTGHLSNLLPNNHVIDTSDLDEVYGFALYKDEHDQLRTIVNGKNGRINQYLLTADQDEGFKLNFRNSWQLNSQPEGMVVDDHHQQLYIGEEELGIWKISLTDLDKAPALLPDSQNENNPHISYDIEGLAIYKPSPDRGFLIASIQGSFSYALFDRITNSYLGSFKITGGKSIDAVEETDGLEIIAHPLGANFKQGMLAVQDGFNYDGNKLVGQNFKFVPLEQVLNICIIL